MLLENMRETMSEAHGVGLAAPQINKSIRLFLINTAPFLDDEEATEEKIVEQVFINARMLQETGEEWSFNEGCLSIPNLREDISRRSTITIEYFEIIFFNTFLFNLITS